MSHLPGKFVWFEHLSADIPKARKFYDALFGWHTESIPMGAQRYSMILNGDGTTSDGIGGYRSVAATERPSWMSYISVSDVDATYAAALAAGASAVSAPADFGAFGRGATLTDPTGATFSIWKSSEGDQPDPAKTPIGGWCWNELWTTDDARALSFYEQVFGYTHDTMDMGDDGTYYMVKTGEISRGGLMHSVRADAPSMWLPYVAVADCDATALRAKALGGKVLMEASDIPNIGRYAIVEDPLGAAVAFIKLAG
jgi:predicted enzyme related to lactoylglutathione lyase